MSDINEFDSEYEDFTLESILAEYHEGSSYMDGPQKTYTDVLDEQLQRIIADSQSISPEADTLSGSQAGDGTETVLSYDRLITDSTGNDDGISPFSNEDASNASCSIEPAESIGTDVATESPGSNLMSAKEVESGEQDGGFDILSLFSKKNKGKKHEITINAVSDSTISAKDDSLGTFQSTTQNLADAAPSTVVEENATESDYLFNPGSDFPGEPISAENTSRREKRKTADSASLSPEEDSKTEIIFFDELLFSSTEEGREFETTWQQTYEAENNADEEVEDETTWILSRAAKRLFSKRRSDGQVSHSNEFEEPNAEPEAIEEFFAEEPDYTSQAEKYAVRRHSLMIRSRLALVISIVMGVITLLFERGYYLPGIESNGYILTIVLVGLNLIVVALSIDLLIRAFGELIRFRIGAEVLLLFSTLLVLLSCFLVIFARDSSAVVPFCCVNSFGLALSLWGEYRQLAAMNLSLKTAAVSESPDVYISCYEENIDCHVIKHFTNSPAGFYNCLIEADVSERLYHYCAPFLILIVVALSILGTISQGCSFIRALTGLSCAAASFSALSSFSVPFSIAAKRLRKSGSAIAGWGGTDAIYYADGIRMCEEDLFPAGATITNVEVLDQRETDKVIRYTGSLLQAAESGLSKPFSDFMDKKAISHMKIDSYEVCPGGYSAFVRNENILCGTAACLNLYSVQVPAELSIKNAMYTAIDGRLSAVISIGYRPTKNVQSSLLAMLREKLKLFIAGRDFNISPSMLQQKLQIPVHNMEFLSFTDAHSVSANNPERVPHALAVSVHSTPGSVAETLITAKRLRIISSINTLLSIATTFIGMVIVFFLCRTGSESSVSPTNLCEYMLAMEFIILLVSRIV